MSKRIKQLSKQMAKSWGEAKTVGWRSYWAACIERLLPDSPLTGDEIARRILRVKV